MSTCTRPDAYLSTIYANLRNKYVVNDGITKSDLQVLIETHDRVICMGHGSPYGLMNPRMFPDNGMFIVDGAMISSLKDKSNNIFIWCHADQFLTRYGLSGLCSGMFISELGEANCWRFEDIDQWQIDQSNERFSSIVSKYIDEPIYFLYNKLLIEYEILAKTNLIARFNLERLYLSCTRTYKNPV